MGSIDNPAITVAELTKIGTDCVDAFCGNCGNSWRVPIAFLPQTTTIPKIESLLACPTCGHRYIEVGPAVRVTN